MSNSTRRDFLLTGAAAGSALIAATIPRTAFAGGKWTTLTKEAGITVTTRREKNRQFPTFRGTGRVKSNIWDVIAVIQDASKYTQWLHQCSESGVIKRVDQVTQVVYSKVDSPWPVKDRDVVLRGKIDFINPHKEVKIRFRAIKHKHKKGQSDVVRMPLVEGHWYIVAMGEDKTLVEYQVNADPGGELPPWLVEQASKELPLFTLRNLRKQVSKTQGQYDAFISDAKAKVDAAMAAKG